MIQQNETINVGSSTTWDTSEWTCCRNIYCTNRLPCGVCRLMQMMCPLVEKPYDVTRKNPYEVTCKAEVQE